MRGMCREEEQEKERVANGEQERVRESRVIRKGSINLKGSSGE